MTIWLGYRVEKEEPKRMEDFDKLIDEIVGLDEDLADVETSAISDVKRIYTNLHEKLKPRIVDNLTKSVHTDKSDVKLIVEKILDNPKLVDDIHSVAVSVVKDVDRVSRIVDMVSPIARKGLTNLRDEINRNISSKLAEDGRFSSKLDKISKNLEDIDEKMYELRTKIESIPQNIERDTRIRKSEGIKSIKIQTITDLYIEEDRWLVEHKIPFRGTEQPSVIYQDLGRKPTRISFRGILVPDEPQASLIVQEYDIMKKMELLQSFLRTKKPLFFASRLVHRAETPAMVTIEQLRFKESARIVNCIEFECTLVEYSDVYEKHDEEPAPQAYPLNYQTLEIVTRYREQFIIDGTVDKEKIMKTLINETLYGGRSIRTY